MSLQHGVTAVFHLPALCRALVDGVEHFLHVKTGYLAECNGLGEALNQPGNADLIHHFGELPATDRAHAAAGPGEGRNHWLCAIKHRLFGAAHDRELAIFGTGLPPGNRSIHEMHPLRAGKGIQFSRHLGRGGGVIHQRTSGPHARQGSIVAQHHAAQVIVVADAAKHQIGVGRCFTRGRGRYTAALAHPLRRFGRRAVVHRDLVPCAHQVGSHRVAHDAQAQESHSLRLTYRISSVGDLAHSSLLSISKTNWKNKNGRNFLPWLTIDMPAITTLPGVRCLQRGRWWPHAGNAA